MAITTSFRLTEDQIAKLGQLAKELGRTRNYTMGQLIDNAVIAPVVRQEVTAVLPRKSGTDGKGNNVR